MLLMRQLPWRSCVYARWHNMTDTCTMTYILTSRNPFFKGKPPTCQLMYSRWQMADVWSVQKGGGVPWSTSMSTSMGVPLPWPLPGGYPGPLPWPLWGGGYPGPLPWQLPGGVPWSTSMTTSGGYPGPLPWPLLGGGGYPGPFPWPLLGGGGYPGPLPWPLLGGPMWPIPQCSSCYLCSSMTTSKWPLPWPLPGGGSHVTYPTMQFMLSLLSRHKNDGSGLVHMLI